MIYIFIDESGDYGGQDHLGASPDFAMSAVICNSLNIETLTQEVHEVVKKIDKKEIKFSKLSLSEIKTLERFFETLSIEYYSVYTEKTKNYSGEKLLKNSFTELLDRIDIKVFEKVKIIIDGVENKGMRKIYEPIIRKRFSRSVLKFANSRKTPMIQVADFYAGKRRKDKK